VLGPNVAAKHPVLERVVEANPLQEGQLALEGRQVGRDRRQRVTGLGAVGQNSAFRVPFGVANTTSRVGAATVDWP